MGDGNRFDNLTRIWAAPISRRRALKLSAGAVLGAAAANVLHSSSASADTAPPCVVNSQCRSDQVCNGSFCFICGFSANGTCGPGNQCVGLIGGSCLCFDSAGGSTECNSACCNGTCCPAGMTSCVNGACACPTGAPACGSGCCRKGETCSDPNRGCCCPKGSTPCGATCCATGVACLDPANGICGCPPRTTPCGSPGNLTCCPAGTACQGGCPPPTNNTASGGYCL